MNPVNVILKVVSVLVATTAAALIALASPNENLIVTDSCDYVEINHVYNIDHQTGEPTLRMIQYIWWEWRATILLPVLDPVTKKRTGHSKQGSGFVVREYLVVHSGSSRPNNVATVAIEKKDGKWICIFWDKDDKFIRSVTCGWISETHTTYDTEIANRDVLHTDFRNGFRKR